MWNECLSFWRVVASLCTLRGMWGTTRQHQFTRRTFATRERGLTELRALPSKISACASRGTKKMAHLYCEFKRVRQANDVFGVRRGVLWAFVNKKTIQRSQISENNPCLVLHQRQGLWFPCPFCVAFCFVHSLLQHAEESYLKGCSGSALTKTRYNRRPPNYKNSK